MTLPQPLQDWIDRFREPENAPDEPFQPTHPDDLIGVEIVYIHPQSEELWAGEVIDWQMHPRGLYLLVSQYERNVPKWVHESNFVRFGWETAEAAVA